MKSFWKIVRKEFDGFFASPAAWLFMGAFLVVSLFVFFWAEAFFARNIADLKPLFEWMPVLLIFLVGTLSMRTWSEERRSGTVETLLTRPVATSTLVLGKFTANLGLVALALLLTLPLALSVATMGPLDWGPVIGGYVASLFLASAYVAVGLFMSSRTDNPIVALILTVAVSGLFYLVGSPLVTTLFGHRVGGLLELIGSGARFDSITRGVLDLRDLYYYLSIVGVFLALNVYGLERLRWAGNPSGPQHRRWSLFTLLMALNLLAANFWLQPLGGPRLDLTEGKLYTLSEATENTLRSAAEPVLIRGYFSRKSHPLLEPLVPRLKDLLEEYGAAGGARVRVEFVDPHKDQTIAEEAARQYDIRPVPFQMASRYEAGVVNSYFDVLVQYGDSHETLSFDDLIEVKGNGMDEPEVVLKNPEYAITRALRKTIRGYRAGGDVFAPLPEAVTFRGFVSPAERLPEELAQLRAALEASLRELQSESGGKLEFQFEDPDAGDGTLAEQLRTEYGFAPQVAGLFDTQPFWFYMVIEGGGQRVRVPLPETLDAEGLESGIRDALRGMAPSSMKTIAWVEPEGAPPRNPMTMGPPPGQLSFTRLSETLDANARLVDTDLSSGQVPAEADLLLLLAPESLSEEAVFAVDQFLMRGGAVVALTSPFSAGLSRSISIAKRDSGLADWLASMGLSLGEKLVLDPQNASLPVPVPRNLGGITVREIVRMPYPHFPDIREAGLSREHPMTVGMQQLTVPWASPIELPGDVPEGPDYAALVHSSPQSWTTDSTEAMPDYQAYPNAGFARRMDRSRYVLAASAAGEFASHFAGERSPLLPEADTAEAENTAGKEDEKTNEASGENDADESYELPIGTVLQKSSDSARLVLVASNNFAEDSALQILSQGMSMEYTAPLEWIQNAVDWALDDTGLMEIRGRTRLARTLEPMEAERKQVLEWSNYGFALAGLGFVWFVRLGLRRARRARHEAILAKL